MADEVPQHRASLCGGWEGWLPTGERVHKLGRHNTGPLQDGLETAGSDPDGIWGRISPSRAAVHSANGFAMCGKVALAAHWACIDGSTRGAFGIGSLFASAAIDNNEREGRALDSKNTLRWSSLFRGDIESRLVSVVCIIHSSPLADAPRRVGTLGGT